SDNAAGVPRVSSNVARSDLGSGGTSDNAAGEPRDQVTAGRAARRSRSVSGLSSSSNVAGSDLGSRGSSSRRNSHSPTKRQASETRLHTANPGTKSKNASAAKGSPKKG